MLPQPVVTFINERNVRLVEQWQIATCAGILVCVPGAESDGASIPEVFWSLPGYNPFEGDTLPAAFAHDQLYGGELCDRATADSVLYQLLRAGGVSWFRANTYWLAVRAFGGFTWSSHNPASVAENRKCAKLIS
jgi:membrane protease subunit (stomatin/prohibitin family)